MRKALAAIATSVARLIALVCAALFVIVAVVVLLLFNVERQLLRPGLYKRALAQQGIYERFPALLAEQMVLQMTYRPAPEMREDEGAADEEGSGPPEQFKYLTQADYEAILSDLLPADWLQTQAESAIDQAFAYLDSDAETASIVISLVAVRQRIGGEHGVHAALELVRSWPPCSEEQLASFTRALSGAGLEGIPTCRPPEKTLTAISPMIEEILGEAAAEIPDEVDLARVFEDEDQPGQPPPPDTGGPEADPRQQLRMARWGLRLSPLLPAGLVLLITMFGVRSWKGLLRWWGIPFLLAGLIGVNLAVAGWFAMNWAVANYLPDKIPAYLAPGLVQVGVGVGRTIARTLLTRIGAEAGLLGLLGFVLLVGSFFVRFAGSGSGADLADRRNALG